MTHTRISQLVKIHHNSKKQGFPVMGEVLEAQGSSNLISVGNNTERGGGGESVLSHQ